jgi:hypothetical protein
MQEQYACAAPSPPFAPFTIHPKRPDHHSKRPTIIQQQQQQQQQQQEQQQATEEKEATNRRKAGHLVALVFVESMACK